MKKVILFLSLLTYFYSVASFSTASNYKINLKVNFDWLNPNEPLAAYPVHVNKTITFDTRNPGYVIAFNEAYVLNYKTTHEYQLPFSLVLLVKPTAITDKTTTLLFELFQYGFQNQNAIVTQPQLILNNGQPGGLNFKSVGMKLSATATWEKI